MSRKSRKVPILAQDYVRKTMPLTIEIARALTEAYDRDKQLDPLDDIAAAASKTLTDAGIPSSGDVAFELPKLVAAKGFDERTPEWYAAEVLDRVHTFRVAAPNFQGFERDWRLIRLGRLIRSAEIEISKPGALDHAVNLRDKVESARADKKADADRRHERWKSAAREEWRHNRKLSPKACAKKVIVKLRLKERVDTVRKIIASEKPKIKLASL